MIRFEIALEAPGWARFDLANEAVEISISASGLSDALSQLINCAAILAEGVPFCVCKIQAEPGEFRLFFKASGTNLSLSLLSFADTFSRAKDEDGKLLFEGSESTTHFVRTILRQFERLSGSDKGKGYHELWGHPYPLKELMRLRESLKGLRATSE